MMVCNLLYLFVTLGVCSAYKLLVVFPVPGKSHAILGEAYVRHLLAAGHEVTYVTPVNNIKPSPNLRVVDVSDKFRLQIMGEVFNVKKIINKEVNIKDVHLVRNLFIDIANSTVTHPNVRKLMEDPNERFDLVIVEWLYTELISGFSLVFDCPYIWSSSMDPHAMVMALMDGAPNPAYTADIMSADHPPFTFWQRVDELWIYLKNTFTIWSLSSKESQIFTDAFHNVAVKRGVKVASFEEVKYNGSLMLGNSHISFGQPISTPQSYKPILGYHIPETIAPLPEHIQKIMDNAPHGVIYFSMGSMLKAESFPSQLKQDLVTLFSGLRQTVLWKFEENLPDLPKNVHIVNWAPQMSVLAHPNCILFISHGGLLSLTEAIHFAVPIIGVPAFADQFLNMDRVARKGFGKVVNLDDGFANYLKNAISDVLGNPGYRAKAKEVSYVYHHRLSPPGAELVHWVEHVITTRGAPHLRSWALCVPFYQKYYLDLVAVLLTILGIVATIVLFLRKKIVETDKKNK